MQLLCGKAFERNLNKRICMKKYFFYVTVMMGLIACNSGENNTDGSGEKDPSTVHPPSEAIPDSTKLVNDSVIMPDTTPGNGSEVGNSDSIQKNRQ